MSKMRGFTRLAVVFGLVMAVSGPKALAAQVGKVIVDQAELHEYPQSGSKVLARIAKDTQVTVSNAPTEGFYKARTATGQIGWISGNDLFVKGGARGAAPARKGRSSYKPEDMRLQAMYGLDMLSFGGLGSVFTTTGIGAKSFAVEGQFRLNQNWFWALRAEMHSGSQPDTVVGADTQKMAVSLIPVMVGANYTLMQTQNLRVGGGVYLGMAVVSSTTITQTDATQVEEVKYSSLDPCADLNLSGAYSLSDALGLLLEVGYRYHKTGEFPATTRFGGVSGFAIDYSGITIRAGVELKL